MLLGRQVIERGAQRPTGRHTIPVVKMPGITEVPPPQDLGRAKAFYAEKVGLQALEFRFLGTSDGQVGLAVEDGVNQLFVYPAQVRAYLGSGKQGSPSPDNTTVIPVRLVCVYRPWRTNADLHVGP